MRLFIVILAAFLCGLVSSLESSSKDGTMFIDSLVDVTTIKPNQKIDSKDSESSGDDEEGSGDVQGDSSGSGSGAVKTTVSGTVAPTTKEENVVREVVTVKKVASIKPATESKPVTEAIEVLTEQITEIGATTISPAEPTTSDDTLAGGVPRTPNTPSNAIVQAQKREKEGLRVLTKEVIAAVIVGGICAIILIAFLVYRLRKRDEGSYVLTDSTFKDTNKLRGDPGKEAFV